LANLAVNTFLFSSCSAENGLMIMSVTVLRLEGSATFLGLNHIFFSEVLMTMLQTCSHGLTVMNIYNGFSAGVFAALIAGQAKTPA